MTDPDEVFAMFVDANPVPEQDQADRGLTVPVVGLDRPAPFGQRIALVAVAAACLAAMAVGGWWINRARSLSTTPADPDALEAPLPEQARLAMQWQESVNAGDVSTALRMSLPDYRTQADRRVYEWLAGFAANQMPVTLDRCTVEPETETSGTVTCDAQLGDLVAIELGQSELRAPFNYEDGLLAWRPYHEGDISEVNAAYADYLSLYQPERYREACTSIVYEPGTIVLSERLALTGECAELAAPLAGDVVEWIRAGRPAPGD